MNHSAAPEGPGPVLESGTCAKGYLARGEEASRLLEGADADKCGVFYPRLGKAGCPPEPIPMSPERATPPRAMRNEKRPTPAFGHRGPDKSSDYGRRSNPCARTERL